MGGIRQRLRALKGSLYNVVAVFLAIVLPALLVIRAWNAEVEKAEGVARASFEARAVQIRDAVSGRLLDYEQVLRGAAGLFAASGVVSRDEWRNYYESLRLEDYYPGIQGIGFAPRVSGGGIDMFVGRIRESGYSGYRINPPGEREEYVPVAYIEPFSGRNLRAFGFDALTDPVRRSALERAMEHNPDRTCILGCLPELRQDQAPAAAQDAAQFGVGEGEAVTLELPPRLRVARAAREEVAIGAVEIGERGLQAM